MLPEHSDSIAIVYVHIRYLMLLIRKKIQFYKFGML